MIKFEDLKQSAVVFDEATHTYRRGDEKLSGITSLIHDVLQLGVYPDNWVSIPTPVISC